MIEVVALCLETVTMCAGTNGCIVLKDFTFLSIYRYSWNSYIHSLLNKDSEDCWLQLYFACGILQETCGWWSGRSSQHPGPTFNTHTATVAVCTLMAVRH